MRAGPGIPWQLDGTRPGLSIVTIAADHPEGGGEIRGIAEADERWTSE